jgi:hypothetical protein
MLLVLGAGALVSQVLMHPVVGIADNGDFPKMAGALALKPAIGDWDSNKFHDFVYSYVWDQNARWITGFHSSEFWLLKVARGAQRLLYPGLRFDIRWLGTIHALVLLLGIGV